MPSAGRAIVWSLLTAIVILLLGLMGLLYVAYNRDKQYQTEIQNLRHKIAKKDAQIEELQNQIRPQTPKADTSWTISPNSNGR